jgi:hypothetical protein
VNRMANASSPGRIMEKVASSMLSSPEPATHATDEQNDRVTFGRKGAGAEGVGGRT